MIVHLTLLIQAIVNGLEMGFLYALVAVGLTIIWGLMEMINFAHGEFLMLGMFGAWWASTTFGLDPLVAIVPVGLAMYALGVLVYRQLMRRVQRGDPFTQIFATVGLLFLLQNSAVAVFTKFSRFGPSDCASAVSHSVPITSVPARVRPDSPTNVRSRISVSAVRR